MLKRELNNNDIVFYLLERQPKVMMSANCKEHIE